MCTRLIHLYYGADTVLIEYQVSELVWVSECSWFFIVVQDWQLQNRFCIIRLRANCSVDAPVLLQHFILARAGRRALHIYIVAGKLIRLANRRPVGRYVCILDCCVQVHSIQNFVYIAVCFDLQTCLRLYRLAKFMLPVLLICAFVIGL